MAEAEREKVLQNKIKMLRTTKQTSDIVNYASASEEDEDLKLLKKTQQEDFHSQSSILTVKQPLQKIEIENVNSSTGNGRFHVKDTWSSYTNHEQLDLKEKRKLGRLVKQELQRYESEAYKEFSPDKRISTMLD